VNLTPSEKKTLALIGVCALLYAAVIAGAAAFWASRTHVDDRPYVTLSAGPHSTRAYPTVLCDYQLQGCDGDFRKLDPARLTRFPVPIGESLKVRLSSNVAGDPWSVVVQYLTPNGSQLLLKNFRSGTGTAALLLPSTRTRILINVEISLPAKMLAGDSDDQLVRRGLFAINTTPTDQKPLIDAYEKAATGKDPDQRMVDDVKEFAKD